MTKQTKKKLEQELMNAIETVLAKHDTKGIAKTKKSIKQAGKSVAKKFNKTLKAIAAKKEAVAKAKKKVSKKIIAKKTVVLKPTSVKRSRPKTKVVKVTATAPIIQPFAASDSTDSQNM